MTSNLGSILYRALGDRNQDEMRAKVTEALHAAFRPEFLNRIDEIVIFTALTREEIGQIVDFQMTTVSKRLAERQINVQVTTGAKEWLSQRGYDPVFGARPLKRLIQREVLDPLSMKVLSGELHDGETILIDRIDDRLVFTAALTAAPMVA